MGHHFKIVTNHRTIQYFLNQRITTLAQQKWLLKLLGYDYNIVYMSRTKNVVNEIFTLVMNFMNDLQLACEDDENDETQKLLLAITQGTSPNKHFSIVDEKLFYKKKIFVLDVDQWRVK